jgi:hypothetical protein
VRLEFREPAGSDVVVHLDLELKAGDVRRTDTELRLGTASPLDGYALRTAAALAARTMRAEGGTIAWRASTEGEVRAIVEGTAYGAYDPGLFKRDYETCAELTLVRLPVRLLTVVASTETCRTVAPTSPATSCARRMARRSRS